jgi:hypothetical protein
MSWLDVLGATDFKPKPPTHNTQNTQNYPKQIEPAGEPTPNPTESREIASRLLEVLARICKGLSITPTVVLQALSPTDIVDWNCGDVDDDTLRAFATALEWRRDREQGRRPACDSEQTTCKQCGPIWSWFADEVAGCPWCRNRIARCPIPRPIRVTCGSCVRFEPDAINPIAGLGSCTGHHNPPSTLCFPRIKRQCDYWIPENSR